MLFDLLRRVTRWRCRIALVASLLLSGCTLPAGGPKLRGDVPIAPVLVGDIALPEVRPGGGASPFEMRARADGLLLVFFGFVSCPDICPTTLSDARRAIASLGPSAGRVDVAFITVDPQRDSSAVLLDYLASFFERGAHALRPATQAELGRAQVAFRATSSITRQTDGHIDVAHTATTSVVDAAGRVQVEWAFGTSSADMAHDLRVLLAASRRPRADAGAGPDAAVSGEAPAASASDELSVSEAWVRASPRGATMGAAYLTLQSAIADRLLAVETADSVAGAMEMHQVLEAPGGALRMQQVAAIELPAGAPVVLRPGGRHLMFIDLRRPLVAGTRVELRLRFERAGERRVLAEVR